VKKTALFFLLLFLLLFSGCSDKSAQISDTTPPVTTTAPSDPLPPQENGSAPAAPSFTPDELLYFFPPYRQTGLLLSDSGALPAGLKVEIRRVESGESAVVFADGEEYTVPWEAVTATLPATPPLPAVTDEQIALAANAMGLQSETPYLLWTDLWRLSTYLLVRDNAGAWKHLATLPCATGSISHPTPLGLYRVNYHEMFLGKENAYLCYYTLQFHEDYLYHSILYDWSGKRELDGRLGVRSSLGCIRHSLTDSRFLYETVPDGTAVLIR
jgi:hypothetical protein